jgi:signal transduction histidine kinase/CheY-like chemotaxis protein
VPIGSAAQLCRDAARLAYGALLRVGRRVSLPRLSELFGRSRTSLHGRIETAWLASGAATQLADAALEGESTTALATRIASIARELSGALVAGVYGRGPTGLQLLGSDGDCQNAALAERSLASGLIERESRAAAIPLRMRDLLVGALTLRFARGDQDLRPLQPLLSRAGAVLAAAEREARKDRFLSLAAHELKTPLTSIKGFSYSLARRLERGESFDARHVEVLERQAERLHSLLEEMLEVSRLETGRFHLHQEPCELVELVEACRRSLRRLAAESGVELQAEAELPLIADRERIERGLTSMVARARALGRPVRLDGRRVDSHAVVRVSWTGRALTVEERDDAFSPRWEAPPGQRQGLGMALYIAREAAQLHGGSLRAEEAAFVLKLPLRSATLEQRGRGVEGRVLVVDDDEPIARMLAEFLAESGFVADWAGGGFSALEKIQQDPPDLIVLDLRMPDLDGRGLLKAIRSLGLSPRVVLLSADREVATAARELATEAFVEKPFAPEGLLVAVRRALKD